MTHQTSWLERLQVYSGEHRSTASVGGDLSIMQAGLAQVLCPHPSGSEHHVAHCVAVQNCARQAALHHDLQHIAQEPQDVDTAIVQDQSLFLRCCSRDFAFTAAVANCVLFVRISWFCTIFGDMQSCHHL